MTDEGPHFCFKTTGPGSIFGTPYNFSIDVEEICWRDCLEQWTEAWWCQSSPSFTRSWQKKTFLQKSSKRNRNEIKTLVRRILKTGKIEDDLVFSSKAKKQHLPKRSFLCEKIVTKKIKFRNIWTFFRPSEVTFSLWRKTNAVKMHQFVSFFQFQNDWFFGC